MKIMPMISVIVPVYKVKEKLLRCSIESILRQTYQDLELLLIDDGSPDKCGMICDEYALRDKRIRVFHTENQGASAARNLGLEQCGGKYVMFVDSDDYIQDTCLEHLKKTIEDINADYVKCGCKKVTTVNALNRYSCLDYKLVGNNEAIYNLCYMNMPFPGIEVTSVWAGLYKRQVIDGVRFNTNMLIGEDFDFNLKAFKRMERIVYLNSEEYGYFIRHDSVMRNGFDKRKLEVIGQLENLIDENRSTLYWKGIVSRSVNIAIVLLLMIPTGKRYQGDRRYVTEFLKRYRLKALKNHHTRIKVKAALAISFVGFDFMRKIFDCINQRN